MKSKKEQILEIAQEIKDLGGQLADQRRQSKTRFVVGEGSLNSKIVFVGEAPGKNEAATGRPFAGAAGKVLDEALASIGLARKSVYITNIVNDRPPNNRDPEPTEIALYSPFLLRQLAIIKPKIVATLGRISMKFLLEYFDLEQPNYSIGQLHGQKFTAKATWGETEIRPLYHPAAALYNRNLIPIFKADLASFKVEK